MDVSEELNVLNIFWKIGQYRKLSAIICLIICSTGSLAWSQDDSVQVPISFLQDQTPNSNIAVDQTVDIDIDEDFSVGGFTGRENQLIIPRICIPLIGCSPEVRADTRTGSLLNGSLSFLNQIEHDLTIANGVFDPVRARFQSRFSVRNGAERDGFRLLRESLLQSIPGESSAWIEIPSFEGSFNISGTSRTQARNRSLVAGEGLDNGFDTGDLNWDMNLFTVDTRVIPPLLESPWVDTIPEFGAGNIEASPLGDFIYRKTFGPLRVGQPPNGERVPLWAIDVLSPLAHFDDGASISANQVEHSFASDALRLGYDLAKSNPALANFLVGTFSLGANFRLDYDLFSATIGAVVGYGERVEIMPMIGERQLSVDRPAELRLNDGSLIPLSANSPYVLQSGSALPEIRTLDGSAAQVTVTMTTLPIDQQRTRVLRVSPMGNLTLLPRLVLQKRNGNDWQTVRFLGKAVGFEGLAHVNINFPIEIPLETVNTPTLEGLLPDQTLVSDFELRASGDTPGFNDGNGALPTVVLTHPLTTESRISPQITRGTASADVPVFQAPDGQLLSFNEIDLLELLVDDLQVKGFDLGSQLNSVFVAQDQLLSVLHADSADAPALDSLISDGTTWLRADSGQTAIRLRRSGDLVFAGTGTTVIESDMLLDAPLTEESTSVMVDREHTLLMRGSNLFRIGTDGLTFGDVVLENAPARFVNDGIFRIEDDANVDMEYFSLPNLPHLNTGQIFVDGASDLNTIYSSLEVLAPYGLTQEGRLEASNGGWILLDGSDNPGFDPQRPWRQDLNLFNESGASAVYRASGDGSRLVIGSESHPTDLSESRGRPLLHSGVHRFELVENARFDGYIFGPVLPDDPETEGTVAWFTDSGGAISLSGPSTLDGLLEIGPDGEMGFHGLFAQNNQGLSIVNEGRLEFSGMTTSLQARPDLATNFQSEVIRINFETTTTSTPASYLRDAGEVFGERGNGLRYGWSVDMTDRARERSNPASPDLVHDTLLHMFDIDPSLSLQTWSIELPNGLYRIDILAGDADFQNSMLAIQANGAVTVSEPNSSASPWQRGQAFVDVRNGLLELDHAIGAINNKINAIEITPLDSLGGTARADALVNSGLIVLSEESNVALPVIASDFAADGLRVDLGGALELNNNARLILDFQRPRSDAIGAIEDPNTTDLPLALTELAGEWTLGNRSDLLFSSEDEPDRINSMTSSLTRISGNSTFVNRATPMRFDNTVSIAGQLTASNADLDFPDLDIEPGAQMTIAAGANLTTDTQRIEVLGGRVEILGPNSRLNGMGRTSSSAGSSFLIASSAEVVLYSEVTTETPRGPTVQAAELVVDLPSSDGINIFGDLIVSGTLRLRGEASRVVSSSGENLLFDIHIDGGTVIVESGATLVADNIRMDNGGIFDIRSGGRVIVSNEIILNSPSDRLLTQEGAYVEARQVIQNAQDVDLNHTLNVVNFFVNSGRFIRGSGTIIGRNNPSQPSAGFDINTGTFFEPSPPGFTFYADVRFRPNSNYVVNVSGFDIGAYGRTTVYGVLNSERDASAQRPRLQINFNLPESEVVPNVALSVLEALPGIDENGEVIPETGRFGLESSDDRFFGFIKILGLPGFQSDTESGIEPRYQVQAPGGIFLGQLGQLDLYVFNLAGDNQNHYTFAFIDGRLRFQNGFPPPDRIFTDRFGGNETLD